jgi:hypothetical protein
MYDIIMPFHSHKRVMWTMLGMTMMVSLSTIHRSFQVATTSSHDHYHHHSWRILDDLTEPLGIMNRNHNLRNRVDSSQDENEAWQGLAENEQQEDGSKNDVNGQLRQQALEIKELKKALEAVKLQGSQSIGSSTTRLGASVRLLWEQLRDETPPGNTTQKVLANLKPRDPSPRGPDDIVLVTHGSTFKLPTFLTQLHYWNGPASLALYLNQLGGDETAPDAIALLETFLEDHQETLRNTSIHLLMEYTNSEEGPVGYPHNPLRNLAMDQSDGDYVVALDVDFIPQPRNCYSKLLATLEAHDGILAEEIRQEKLVMVLPAFEVYAPKGKDEATPKQLPNSKKKLYDLVQSDRAENFQTKRYPPGHGPTKFKKWFEPVSNLTSVDKKPLVPFYPIYYKPGFEPYVLVYRPGIPRYWNDFRGFGRNKLSWFQELHLAGYMFETLWDFFVVHLEHPKNFNWDQLKDNVDRNKAFLKYLREQYPLRDGHKPRDRRRYFSFRNKKMPKQKKNTTGTAVNGTSTTGTKKYQYR